MKYLMLLTTLIVSCSTLKNERVNHDVSFITNHDGEEVEHTLNLEQSFTVKNFVGDHEKEKNVHLKDSIIVFFTDDLESLSYVNSRNKEVISDSIFWDYVYQKSSDISGEQKNGTYWRQKRINGVAVGYVNVPEKQKKKFDSIIDGMSSRSL